MTRGPGDERAEVSTIRGRKPELYNHSRRSVSTRLRIDLRSVMDPQMGHFKGINTVRRLTSPCFRSVEAPKGTSTRFGGRGPDKQLNGFRVSVSWEVADAPPRSLRRTPHDPSGPEARVKGERLGGCGITNDGVAGRTHTFGQGPNKKAGSKVLRGIESKMQRNL